MKTINRALAVTYFILSAAWFIYGFFFIFLKFKHLQIPTIATTGVLGGLFILLLGVIHWKISGNTQWILREKVLVACSSINILFALLCVLIIGLIKGESGIIILPTSFFLVIFSFLTLLFGIVSVFKISKKILFWIVFLLVAIGVFLEAMNVLFLS